MLQIFYILEGAGTLLYIFLQMTGDMMQWGMIYVILVVAMAMGPLGVADPQTLIQSCDEENDWSAHDSDMKMTCFPGYNLYRTFFQSFGELFLEDMRNEISVVVLVVTFFVLNIMLMNLLIAQVIVLLSC